MKKLLSFLIVFLLGFVIVACSSEEEPLTCDEDEIIVDGECVPDPDLDDDNDVDDEPLTVAEVIETDDLTFVEFVAIVSGYDQGKRHVVVEDPDGDAVIQLFSGTGYPLIEVGDEVLITGFRTFDRSTDRIAPESLEILSSDNPTSRDNPTVIDSSELNDWTNENRVNEDILFRWYTFTNVEIVSISGAYWYIDDEYDDEPDGRGLKLGVKDTSYVAPDDYFFEGETYTFTAILYGSSDDFFDEARDGTVMRLSVLSEEDIIHHVEEPTFNMSGRSYFLTGEEAPDLDTYFTLTDPTDGMIEAEDLTIDAEIDMDVADVYPVEVTYVRSTGVTFSETFNIEVMDEGRSVTEAIEADSGTEILVEGIVAGYGLRSNGRRVPLVVEDPTNGNAIELWTNSDAYAMLEVGDRVVIYSGSTTIEKGQPRLNSHQLITIKDHDNDLFAPTYIEDLEAWTADVVENDLPIFGRYTFTAEMIDTESSSTYNYFTQCGEERCLQFAIHQDSAANFDWVEGTTYTVTGVIYGVSDPIDVLDDPNSTTIPTIRFGVMDEADIEAEVETVE